MVASTCSYRRLLPSRLPPRTMLAAMLTAMLAVMLALPGCARFQKVDVEREFKHFVALYEEMNNYTEVVFLMEHSRLISDDLSDFFIQKIFETKIQLESVIDIIFFYKYSDFRNYENYLVVYRYVNQRLDTMRQGFVAQRKFIENVHHDNESPHLRKYTADYADYLGRIIQQIDILKEKTK